MQTIYLSCDKSQGTIEITLSKREVQMENVVISADYELVAENKYKVTYFIGFTDYDIQKEIATNTVECLYSDLKYIVQDTIRAWMKDKKTRASMREELREMLKHLALSYRSIRMIEYNLLEKLADYGKIMVLVEINEVKKVYCVYVRNMFEDLLKVYVSDLPNVHENDYEVEIAKEIENDIGKLIEFVKVHESEMRFMGDDNE